MLTYDFLKSIKMPNSPKQITATKIRLLKMEWSTPKGLQYTLSNNIIVIADDPIFMRFDFYS